MRRGLVKLPTRQNLLYRVPDEGLSTPEDHKMKCPHCTTNFHDEWWETPITHGSANKGNIPFIVPKGTWHYRTTVCSDCKNGIIEIAPFAKSGEMRLRNWRMVYPIGASRGPVSPEVPIEITEDYIEACSVLPISTKASAA